jgi:phytoene dehydrogenase-like protein
VYSASDLEAYNPNYVGGDINSGAQDLNQLFTRPVVRLEPYSTPLKGVYLCSSSTPQEAGCTVWLATTPLRWPCARSFISEAFLSR